MPTALIVAVVVTGLGITSIAAGQVANTPNQNNITTSSTSQPSCLHHTGCSTTGPWRLTNDDV
jgi:hypothetical protein